MHIDPIVELAEELRTTEQALHSSTGGRSHDAVRDLLLEIGYLENRMALTTPTSAVGAGELLKLAAQYLVHADARYANRLNQIAGRLCDGKRRHGDLVWLRALAPALAKGDWGAQGERAERLVSSAIRGAARPVLVHRLLAAPERQTESAPIRAS